MIEVVALLLIVAGFVLWDRRSPTSASPDTRMIRIGVVLAAIGAVFSFIAWWAIVPVVVLLVGATMIVVGRHRVVSAA